MASSWTKTWSEFKSPLRVVVGFLQRSRAAKESTCQELERQLEEAKRVVARQQAELERQREVIGELNRHKRRLESAQPGPRLTWADDPPVKGHGYGARMVQLAATLAQAVGLRGAERAMKILFTWLGVDHKVPHATTIRTWLQRLGVAELNQPVQKADDWIWIVDHSNQMGVEKVLTILAVRAAQLPARGQTLKHEDVRVLLVQPGTQWKGEDLAAIYKELAERQGAPRALLCDGAKELRDGVAGLQELRADTIVLPDFKHKAANFLKALLGRDERFAAFSAQAGRTRSAIQQTELAHLTPPGQKQKARFMNLDATLTWAAVSLWVLNHPQTQAEAWGVTTERLEEKLGWLRSFAEDLAVWRECQQVVNKGLTFINEQGLSVGAADQLRKEWGNLQHDASRRLADQLSGVVADAEQLLQKGERLPLSTEILESTFAVYKQLEGQHAQGGFTSLLASLPALLKKTTASLVQQAFAQVAVKDVRRWVRTNLGQTLTSKRLTTYSQFRAAKSATKLAAVT